MKPSRGKTPKKTPRKINSSRTKDPVEVYCRIRPLDVTNEDVCLSLMNSTTVQLIPPETSHAYKNGNYKETRHSFKFVFDKDTSQKALFDHVSLPLVDDLLGGKHSLLFMYGITGSGKTHTMQGTPTDGGILPRCLDVIFNSLGDLQAKKYVFRPDRANGMDVQTEADAMMERQKRDLLTPSTPRTPATPRRFFGAATGRSKTPGDHHRKDRDELADIVRVPDTTKLSTLDEDSNYSIFVSYIEIYNNYIYDLLDEVPADNRSLPSKSLREDATHNMYVANCNEVEVKTSEEAYACFMRGQKQRRVAHTKLNTESSRSHSVFNIRLVQAPLDPIGQEVVQDKSSIVISQLALVDLAGSERTNRTKSAGDRLREAGNINSSLMTLRSCIETLRENQTSGSNKIVPYRDSKITHLFKNNFDGEGKVRMVVCVNPKAADYDETTHVMRFAEVTQEVQIARQTAPRSTPGFTPGRRRAHEMYRRMLDEERSTPVAPPRPSIVSMGPPFPSMQMTDPSDNTLQIVLAFLAEREKRRQLLDNERRRKEELFRTQLMEFERERETMLSEKEDLKKEVDRYKKKLRSLETEKNAVVRGQAHSRQELQKELEEKEKQLKKEQAEKDKLRLALKGVAHSEKEKWEKEFDKRIKSSKLQLENQLWVKDAQLRQLKEIVCGDNDANEVEDEPHRPQTRKSTAMNRSKSPPPMSNAPPVKIKHRRSRSTSNNVWVDHKPTSTLFTETVLQPVGPKKKKTVATPLVKDFKNKDNYMLTHQEEDSHGEVETMIYKADVMQTRGGGRAIQFIDVENLRTGSPSTSPSNNRKRRSNDHESGDWTDVETRCSYGIEGRPGQSQPSIVHTGPSKKVKK